MLTQVSIPDSASWFYVSDAFSLTNGSGQPVVPVSLGGGETGMFHFPGIANQELAMVPGQKFAIWIKSCSLSFVRQGIYTKDNTDSDGINVDLHMWLYNTVTGTPVPQPTFISYGKPYTFTDVNPSSMVMNHVFSSSNGQQYKFREFGKDSALRFDGCCPSDPGVYQIGAGMKIFAAINAQLTYDYHIHGAIGLL